MAPTKASRSLRPRERRLLVVLGIPILAMAFSTTCVSTYLPVLARKFTASTTVIIAGEGQPRGRDRRRRRPRRARSAQTVRSLLLSARGR